jgi:hypothetical protein
VTRAAPEPMSTLRRVAYGLGNGGYQITDRIVVALAVYFYLPPPGRGLTPQIPEQVFFGFVTLYGLSLWVFTYLLSRFGRSPEEPLGVLMLGPVAGVACRVAIGLYALYPERRVLAAGRR